MNNITFVTVVIALCCVSTAISRPILAVNYSSPSIKQISADVFTCDSSEKLLNAVCKVALPRINSELESNGLSVNQNAFLFQFDDSTDKKIKGGCSRSAKLKRQRVDAKISRSARIDLQGDSLDKPFAVRLELPVSVSAKFDIKQRYGAKVFGSCSNYASDSFSLKGSVSTIADVVVGITFNPSFGEIKSGDYALVIEPKLALLAHLRNTDISLRASGVSPFSGVLTFVTGAAKAVFESVEAIFNGDSISDIFDEFVYDLAHAAVLGVGALPRPLEDVLFDILGKLVLKKEVKKEVEGFRAVLENDLRNSLKRNLKLDGGGKRVFVIKRDVVNLVNSFGAGADVFAAIPPFPSSNPECQQAEYACSNIRDLSSYYSQCAPARNKCESLKHAHKRKYEPSDVITTVGSYAS